MRFAAIADVHGNCLALEAVLVDIGKLGIESVVNLGDHVSGPLEARRTAELLMSLNCPSVRGNHDRWLTDKPNEALGLSDKAAKSELASNHLAWLKALPATLVFEGEVLLCHGTPRSDTGYWLERVRPDGSIRMATRTEVAADAAACPYPLVLCAHTHIPRAVRLTDNRLIVNPGSVGLPGYDDDHPVPHIVETGNPDASYAVLDKIGGRWTVMFRSVPYDNLAMAALAKERGREEWARALATGWLS